MLDVGIYGYELCFEFDGFYDWYFRDIVFVDFLDVLVINDDILKVFLEVG